MKMIPKISIIIPTFNSENTVSCCLDSIHSQEFTDYEVLIIDGGSCDKTLSIVQNYKNIRFKIHSEPDKGIYDAMNKGIKLAIGDWIYFLGSDDYLVDSKVLKSVSALFTLNYDIIYGDTIWGSEKKGGEFNKYSLIRSNITHQAIFYKKTIFDKLGDYNLTYKIWADYEFNIKCFGDDSIITKYVEIEIANYGINGYSSNFPLDINFCKDSMKIFKNNLKISTKSNEYGEALEFFARNEIRNKFYLFGLLHLWNSVLVTKNFKNNISFIYNFILKRKLMKIIRLFNRKQ
jgi:glycosyltransferase involved in cell wall biosynthesis